MSEINKQVKFVYQGPYKGVDVSKPATDIDNTASPFIDNFMLRNSELRTRPRLQTLMPAPNDGSSVRSMQSFVDINAVAHSVCITRFGIYQLSFNWLDMLKRNTNPWLQIDHFGQAQPDSLYSTAILQTKLYFTNGGSNIFRWNGTSNVIEAVDGLADGTSFSAFFLMELNAKLICAYTTETKSGTTNVFPFRVRWTATAQPNQWDASVNLGAGFNDEFDVPDIITNILPLGRTGYIYRANGITEMIPNGSGNGFDFNHLWASSKGIGNVMPQTLAGYGPLHIFKAAEDFYMLTPNSFNPIGGTSLDAICDDIAAAQGFVFATIVPYLKNNFVYHCYLLTVPFLDGSSKIWVYSLKEQNWTPWRFATKTPSCSPGNITIH